MGTSSGGRLTGHEKNRGKTMDEYFEFPEIVHKPMTCVFYVVVSKYVSVFTPNLGVS